MSLNLSPELKAQLLGKIPGVVQEGKDVYFQYDRIVMTPATGYVEFFYSDKPMFWMQTDPVPPGGTLTIRAVSGRVAAHLID